VRRLAVLGFGTAMGKVSGANKRRFSTELLKQFTTAGWPAFYDSGKAAMKSMEKIHLSL